MAIDPETLRQIEALKRDPRPLLVVDVDEVVLEFVTPFANYLASRDFDLGLERFALHGNIVSRADRRPVADERVTALIDEFWGVQADWQMLAEGADSALAALAPAVEVVLLTAMPHAHREARSRHLSALGLPYPVLTTEMAKGPAVRRLRGEAGRRLAFVDDIGRNHQSVLAEVPDAACFHVMANAALRKLLPPLPEGVVAAADWDEALPLIAAALGVSLAAENRG